MQTSPQDSPASLSAEGIQSSPRIKDYVWIALFCIITFGYSAFSGRPLTMHEARLPQTAYEMTITGDYLLPHSGGRPWLERPPLPHWVVLGTTAIFGRHDNFIIERIPSALCGMGIVLICVWMGSRWFGKDIGLISGYVLATCYELWAYSTLAEDDIYLGLLVAMAIALFVRMEWPANPSTQNSTNPIGKRPWIMLLFFILCGLTNLTKGPLLGMVMIGSGLGAFLVWNHIGKQILRYTWVWGLLCMIIIGLSWPMWAIWHYPDVLQNWQYDYLGRLSGNYTQINEPIWYYLPALGAGLGLWAPAALLGLILTFKTARTAPNSPQRFLWCTAVAPLIIFSIPHGKHHHYLVPLMLPWAIISGVALRWMWIKIKSTHPLWNGTGSLAIAVGCLSVVYFSVPIFAPKSRGEMTFYDTQFIKSANSSVASDKTIYINADVASLDFFRLQYYSRDNAQLIHNLTYLLDQNIQDTNVYVVTRASDEAALQQYGQTQIIQQSELSHGNRNPEGRFTLFHLTYDPNLKRHPTPSTVTNLQGLQRIPGPFCGDVPEK